jgi:hypothetical protein
VTAPLRAPVEVAFKATGVDQVRNGLKLVGKDADANLNKIGSASRQIAGGLEAIGRQGKVGGEALKIILAQGAEMAFMFGAGGPIVGALAITGLAIFEHLTGRMKEAEEQAIKTRQEIGNLANASDAQGLKERARNIYLGTPFDANGNPQNPSAGAAGAYQGSLADLEARMRYVKGQMRPGGNLLADLANAPLQRALAELEAKAAPLRRDMNLIMQALGMLPGQSSGGIGAMKITAPAYVDSDQSHDKDAASKYFGEVDRLAFNKKFPFRQPSGMSGTDIPNSIVGPVAAQLPQIESLFDQMVSDPLAKAIQHGFAQTIGQALSEGIVAGFEGGGISGAFKAAGKAILAGLGSILQQMGEVWLEYGVLMTGIGEALWNPITSGPAAIAIGSALIALGATLGAVAHGGRGGGAGGSGSVASSTPQIIDRGLINPMGGAVSNASGLTARSAMNIWVVGTNDPVAGRQLRELLRNTEARVA